MVHRQLSSTSLPFPGVYALLQRCRFQARALQDEADTCPADATIWGSLIKILAIEGTTMGRISGAATARLILAACGLAALARAGAASAETVPLPNLADMSLEQLGNIEVTSVSGRAEPLQSAAASIYVTDPRFSRTVLVAVTGWGSEADRRRSRDAGFDEHLTKPVDLLDLEALLTRAARA
jgi:CheY-like chemotaxis protein